MPELLKRLGTVLDHVSGGPHEIVFADDGSTDRTYEMLEAAARKDSRILVLSLSRNFGHQAAITAALDHVTGDAVVVMDGDLQDVPEVIPQFCGEVSTRLRRGLSRNGCAEKSRGCCDFAITLFTV